MQDALCIQMYIEVTCISVKLQLAYNNMLKCNVFMC